MGTRSFDFLTQSVLFDRDYLENDFENVAQSTLRKTLDKYREFCDQNVHILRSELAKTHLTVFPGLRRSTDIKSITQSAFYLDQYLLDDPLYRLSIPERPMNAVMSEQIGMPPRVDLRRAVSKAARYMTGETEVIGKMLERTTANLSRGGAQERFSYRLPIFRRLARELDEPTSQIATLAREYVSQLHDVDDGLRAIVEEIPAAVQDNPEVTEDVCQFFGQIRGLSQAVRVGIDGVQEWANSILPVERMSRDLRPRLRKLRQALTTLVDARDVTDSWLELMEASSVDCDEFTSGA